MAQDDVEKLLELLRPRYRERVDLWIQLAIIATVDTGNLLHAPFNFAKCFGRKGERVLAD